MDVLVGLVAQIEDSADAGALADRICAALCSLTSLERAVLFLYDATQRITRPVGSHGVDPELLTSVEASLEEAPLAERALAEDRVLEATDHLEREIPPRYARFAGIRTITCGPIAAGGQWFGVIVADRGESTYVLSDEERQTMHTLGRLAALAATVERSTRQHERAQSLDSRISLIREIHEGAIQRLFGLSLVLGSEKPLSEDQMRRCSDELATVLSDLRAALGRRLAPADSATETTLRELVDRQARVAEIEIEWQRGAETPAHLEPLAQSVLIEALRNVEHHSGGGSIRVEVGVEEMTFRLEVTNDAVSPSPGRGGAGLGLRLLTLEALQHDALFEFGPLDGGRWRVRLLAPMEA